MRTQKRLLWSLLGTFSLALGLSFAQQGSAEKFPENQHWQTALRHSAQIAPDPAQIVDVAIVQIYSAPTFGWKGVFAHHPWVIFKRKGETEYTRYEVIAWSGENVVKRNYAVPDGFWYGARPGVLLDRRGEGVDQLISEIEVAIKTYPYAHTYRTYPGPNSNTFMAHIGREVPALKLDLPANFIGKDYRPISNPVGVSPTGSGMQISLLGLLGASVGLQEGVEFNLLGLNFGVDLNSPGLRLPFIGRLGFDDTTVSR